MTDQLRLVDTTALWRLDSDTRRRGRAGIAAARAALAAASPRPAEPVAEAA